MLRMTKQGFTLIELMVVIVIISVLASLAIPRFTEASAKAKVAEAPRVIASYESALLAGIPELPAAKVLEIKGDDLIFDAPKDSKWFEYTYKGAVLGKLREMDWGIKLKLMKKWGTLAKMV
jgi:prepilin-type N-terminal cleavage/methylation domain-containing protein